MGIVTIMGNIVAVTQYDPERIAEKYLELYEECRIFAPRLRENVEGSLGEWLKPAVC